MKIAIIGAGNVGSALAKGLVNAGHEVLFGVRDNNAPKTLNALSLVPNARVATPAEACSFGETIIITTPAHTVYESLKDWGNLDGKTIIDATNAVRLKPEPYSTAYHAIAANTHARVVKCFNTTGFENMLNPQGVDMWMAGDNADAKDIAAQLCRDIGFANCYNFGGAAQVELLEQWALCWINLAIMQGYGRDIVLKLGHR